MTQCNFEIRKKIRDSGLKLWQVADTLGMQDSNFSKKLRKELSEEEKKQILKMIKKMKED